MNAVVTLDPAFQAPVSSVFGAIDAGDDLSGGITGGYGMLRIRGKVWAIHYRDQEVQLMRPDGDGPQGSVELVILKANPQLSKTWYENGWDENSTNPPDCSSANGLVPDNGVPKKQSNTCATCPRNQWGTAPNGGKGKACADHRRLAITPAADIANEAFGGPMLLRCPAASLQDLAAFDNKYKQAGYPYFSMVVKIGFDPKESYPKLVFSAVRPLNDDEAKLVLTLRNGDAVARVIGDIQQPQAVAQTTQQVEFSGAPAGAPVAAAMAQAQPVQQTAPHPSPAGPQPAATAAATTTTGFGGVAAPAATNQRAAQNPAPNPAPKTKMTGFGAAASVTSQVAQSQAQVQQPAQQVAQTLQPAPAPQATAAAPNADAFAASLDDKLAALIGTGA